MNVLNEVISIAKAEDENQIVGYVGHEGTNEETEFQKLHNYRDMENVGWYIVNTKTKSAEYISLDLCDDETIDNPYTNMTRIARVLKSMGIEEMPTEAKEAYKKLLNAVT